ncbi:MAG: hypothetical protein RLZZ437_322 [Pseudomonadota bacterium]|jgi:uncharacterized protein (UPF0276 family)
MINPHLPDSVGVGYKPEHLPFIMERRQPLGFFEVHAENYMGEGGRPHAQLERLRRDYAISIHGVGLSIGGAGPLDAAHLARLKLLCDRYQPHSFSEHLAWSSHTDGYLNDLLPLPYTTETLATVCDHIDQVQTVLGRRMLLENPSTYVLFAQSTMDEVAFLAEVVARTGCGLLLDVNNVFVSSTNHRMNARAYLDSFPLHAVGQIHLGGHAEEELPSGPLLIDAHGTPVAEPVWALFSELIAQIGPRPTLVEWDNDVPAFDVLLAEAQRADRILQSLGAARARAS